MNKKDLVAQMYKASAMLYDKSGKMAHSDNSRANVYLGFASGLKSAAETIEKYLTDL